jgi:hypothetical protein
MTMTSLSMVCVRIVRGCGPQQVTIVRAVEAAELMAVAGWPLETWSLSKIIDHDMPSEQTLTSLAGNAFSAFAYGPVFLGALSILSLDIPTDESDVEGSDGDVQTVSESD